MPTRRPNVLLLFTDQQRGDTVHALGNPVIKTPALDRLCTEGVAFTSCYSASPVCVSARCSLIYGQYPLHTGCYENSYPMPTDRPSFVDALADAGYRTHGIGKCHYTPDRHALRGFQTREEQEEIIGDPENDDYQRWLRAQGFEYVCDPHGVRGEMYYIPQPAQMAARYHPTQWIGDRTVAFIEEQGGSDQPWYLFSSYVHPHPPFCPPCPWHKLYRAPLMPLPLLPPDYESLHTHINRQQNRYKYRDQGLDLNLMRNLKAYYYACISFIDYQVGRILAALERTGQLDNTLILFTSDHGEHLGDYNCFGKRSMHDSCARVPLIARLPGQLDGGQVCKRPANTVDVAATVVAAARADMPAGHLDGVDLADVAAGTSAREIVFSQRERGRWAIHTAVSERWKYAWSAADGKEFLFDRVMDPEETRNKAGISFLRSDLAAMRAALMDHLRAGGETDQLDGDQWKLSPPARLSDDPDTGLLIQDHAWADTRIEGYTED